MHAMENTRSFKTVHGRMGVILFGGGGAQYSLPEQANLTLIFLPKIVGEGGGVSPKNFFRTYTKNFSGHTYKHSTKFSRHSKKIYVIFADTKIFLRHQNFSEIFMFCPNFAVIFARPPAHTPMKQ
jgi:hypothetical protein